MAKSFPVDILGTPGGDVVFMSTDPSIAYVSEGLLSCGAKGILERLNEQLEAIDFTTAVRDPLYREFVDAMSKAEREAGLQEPVLTPEQKQKQRELAEGVLRRLKGEDEQEH